MKKLKFTFAILVIFFTFACNQSTPKEESVSDTVLEESTTDYLTMLQGDWESVDKENLISFSIENDTWFDAFLAENEAGPSKIVIIEDKLIRNSEIFGSDTFMMVTISNVYLVLKHTNTMEDTAFERP
jgi:hypothetical protein